jgi:hypothetical protein
MRQTGFQDALVLQAPAFGGQNDHTVIVPDAHLLFTAEFKRSGTDLKLIGEDGDSVVIHDYFAPGKRASLVAPDGAALTADVVELLAGSPDLKYAQASAPQTDAQPIGRIAKTEGAVTINRNGVAITLNVGDGVLKGDVIQTGSDGAVGVTFIDGSVFSLSAGARIVVNEFLYDPNGSSNAAVINLVQGTVDFLAGQVAKTGSMKVGTPVATMGIRGTAMHTVTLLDGTFRGFVIDEDDKDHLVEIFDLNGVFRGLLHSKGSGLQISPLGGFQIALATLEKTPDLKLLEGNIFQNLMSIGGQGHDPNKTDPDDRTNVQSIQHAGGTQFLPSDTTPTVVTNLSTNLPQGGGNGLPNNPTSNTTPLPTVFVPDTALVLAPQIVTVVVNGNNALPIFRNVPTRPDRTNSIKRPEFFPTRPVR